MRKRAQIQHEERMVQKDTDALEALDKIIAAHELQPVIQELEEELTRVNEECDAWCAKSQYWETLADAQSQNALYWRMRYEEKRAEVVRLMKAGNEPLWWTRVKDAFGL